MKAGDTVFHRTFGLGTIREMRKMGREAFVVFPGGFSLPVAISQLLEIGNLNVKINTAGIDTETQKQEDKTKSQGHSTPVNPVYKEKSEQVLNRFEKSGSLVDSAQKETLVPGNKVDATFSSGGGFRKDHFRARQIIEALRLGIVPSFKVDEITVGRMKERESIEKAFEWAKFGVGNVRTIVGEYGAGKSHLFEWANHEALRHDFLVARTSLDLREVPPNKPHKIYSSLIRSLTFPNRTDGGSLAPLFSNFVAEDKFRAVKKSMPKYSTIWRTCVEPLAAALEGYRRNIISDNEENVKLILDWIAGENIKLTNIRQACEVWDIAKMLTGQNAADQYCYLLSGISWLARQAGYSGLVVLLDESEHYSLLNSQQKRFSDTFFQGMIYSALQNEQDRIPHCNEQRHGYYCGLKHNDGSPFPFFYKKECGLIFMFAVTRTDKAIDYDSWLDQEKIIRLDNFLTPQEIKVLISQIQKLHSDAFNYKVSHKTDAIKDTLISRYEIGAINLRELIKTTVEACDLAYQYPDFDPAKEF
jgi:hypothetical protein